MSYPMTNERALVTETWLPHYDRSLSGGRLGVKEAG
jgi:hypothetical protein